MQLSTQISADNLRSYTLRHCVGKCFCGILEELCDSMSNMYNYNVNFFVSTKFNSTSSQIKHYQFLVGNQTENSTENKASKNQTKEH